MKEDLEILEMINEEDPSYFLVKKHIDKKILEIYGQPAKITPDENAGRRIDHVESSPAEKASAKPALSFWRHLIFGIVCLVIFLPWTIISFKAGGLLWPITSFLVISGLGNILMAIESKLKNRS